MLAIRITSVTGLELHLFNSWADKIMNYSSSVPGNNLQVIVGYYSHEYSVLSNKRDAK